jgi:ketosteroid isomerase-like protein
VSCIAGRNGRGTSKPRDIAIPGHRQHAITSRKHDRYRVFTDQPPLDRSNSVHHGESNSAPGAAVCLSWTPVSLTPNDFDPLAVVVDWLDACRSGDLDAILQHYDEQASLECDCEGVRITGRASLSAYWAGKLDDELSTAFTLEDLTVTADGVWVDYRNNQGRPVRAHFHFSAAGKILRTSCGPNDQRLPA